MRTSVHPQRGLCLNPRRINARLQRAARKILGRLSIQGLTWDDDRGACLWVSEAGSMACYSLDADAIFAICWSRYRHTPRNVEAVHEAVRMLTNDAKAGRRPVPRWWRNELAARERQQSRTRAVDLKHRRSSQ